MSSGNQLLNKGFVYRDCFGILKNIIGYGISVYNSAINQLSHGISVFGNLNVITEEDCVRMGDLFDGCLCILIF
ncbi:hypothetical protein D3C75_1306510 [compost metagenome]